MRSLELLINYQQEFKSTAEKSYFEALDEKYRFLFVILLNGQLAEFLQMIFIKFINEDHLKIYFLAPKR